MAQRQRLDGRAVEEIFRRLSGWYGEKFVAMWRNCDEQNVKESWCLGLGGLSAEEIAVGLNSCRDTKPWPPTLPEFRMLCRPSEGAAYRKPDWLAGAV